jgi:EmrB/QacA subfamily drug resistance transporter
MVSSHFYNVDQLPRRNPEEPRRLNPELPQHPPRRFIAAIVLGATLIPLNSTMIAVALPAIGETFKVSPGDLTLWLVTSYLLVNIILQSPAGKLGDMVGRRRAFEIGLSLFAIGVLIATLVPFLSAVAVSRVLMAAGGAMLLPNAMALLRTVIPEERRPRAFGYFGAILGASAATGPLVGGFLTEYYGWEAIFLVNLPILLLSWVLVKSDSSYERQSRDNHISSARFDFTGMGLLAIGLGIIVTGMRSDGLWPLAAIIFGGLGLYGFTRWEKRTPDPLVDLQLFRRIPFVIGGSIVGLHNLGMYALLFQLPFLLIGWYHLDPVTIGQILLTMTIFMVFFSSIGGRMAESLGARTTVLSGLLISLVGMIMLLATTGSTSLWWMSVSLAWVGAGIGMVMGPAQAAALSAIPPQQSGVASGVLSTMRYLGGVAGITIISTLLTDTDPAAMLAQNKLCFAIYVGVYLIALLLALKLPGRTGTES